jgi:hypothetical protein
MIILYDSITIGRTLGSLSAFVFAAQCLSHINQLLSYHMTIIWHLPWDQFRLPFGLLLANYRSPRASCSRNPQNRSCTVQIVQMYNVHFMLVDIEKNNSSNLIPDIAVYSKSTLVWRIDP